jgi:uncharacterized protein (DUF1015 family)
MPEIQAFRGIRYDLGHVGSLSDVIAPPYDVISPELQDALYKKHPANVVRLILNREEPGDDDANNKYVRAARFLKNWRIEGVLFFESAPSLYVYHQTFTYRGQTHTRRGFMGRCRLQRFGEGNIYPHEETMSGPKADRLLLTNACKTNLSQIFGLYPDANAEVQDLLEAAVAGSTPLEATDHLGVVHRMWPVSDVALVGKISALMNSKPMFVADGHHRYETACNYRDQLAKDGKLTDQHPANYVLMMSIGMNDEGLLVLPTHRLFRGVPELSAEELIAKLGDSFATRIAGEGADLADVVWDEIESEGEQGTLGLFTKKDERWVIARITNAGRARMAQLAPDRSEDWRELGVAVLHRLVIDSLLGAAGHPTPKYVHLVEEVVEGAETGEFPLCALVMPATVDHIKIISEHGERMPAKSTYFYPKLLSGLVLHSLEQG